MATRSVRTTNLVGVTSLSFIRPQRISWSVKDTKPSTILYPFFDGQDVSEYVTPDGGSLGGTITTDAAGVVSGVFDIPGQVFNTGERVFRLQDSEDFDDSAIPGSTVGSASAKFTAAGILNTWQDTVTNITTNEVFLQTQPASINNPWTANDRGGNDGGVGDPLAQTFFTYGVKGGCYITKVDIYFQSKDANIPVVLELRNVVNGYPGPVIVGKYARVSKIPSLVSISNDSSLATVFEFEQPVYLEENKDYCFVLLSNSNSYNVWTSVLGDKSIETGKTIFEQPFVGTLFKSENNVTWTAYQTEDIKFTLYKAAFNTADIDVTFEAAAPRCLVYGSNFSVTSGSAIVTVDLPFMHGHRTGDKVAFIGITGGDYRGIPSATISNALGFIVTRIDDYSFTFNCGANATSTGTLSATGIINAVVIRDGGSGYTAPTVAITGGGGTGATATLQVSGGVIVGATITNAGSGFVDFSTIVATVTDSLGSPGVGAVVDAISETIFETTLNRKYQTAVPVVASIQPPGTSILNTLRTSNEIYTVGTHEITPINIKSNVGKEAVLVNPLTEALMFGSDASTQMILRMSSDNKNVSPMISLEEIPRLRLNNYVVNSYEDTADEDDPLIGTAYARYVSKIISIETPSKGIRVTATAASIDSTWFDIWIRTSRTGDTAAHASRDWVLLSCDVDRNQSANLSDFKDYEFYLDDIELFDVYDLKITLNAEFQHLYPKINNYRSIILAT